MSLATRAGDFKFPNVPLYATLSSLGKAWQVKSAAGLAALTVIPTTTSGLSLFNNEAAVTGNCYVIHSFGSYEAVVDATQSDITAIFAMMNTAGVTPPTDGGQGKISMSGAGAYAGLARTTASLAVTNNGWFPHGPTAMMAPAVAGANWKINECVVDGLYVVQPQSLFSICAVKAAAAAAAQQFYFIHWFEMQLPFA